MVTTQGNGLRFNILGPLEAWSHRSRIDLGGLIQRRVIATLLLEPGAALPVTRLVDAAWGEDPPATASHQVRKTVADLRRRIPGGKDFIVTDGPGYSVGMTADQLDLREFEQQVGMASAASDRGEPRAAVERLRTALALWRGPVLSGLASPVIEAACLALEEHRLAVVERYFALRLELGESTELIGDLRHHVERHPAQETLRAHLMLALYRSGRRADALEEFTRIRELLVEELGISPGPHLTRLYEKILQDSLELAPLHPEPDARPSPPAAMQAPAAPSGPPCNLPYDLPDFVGRAAELQQILACADVSEHTTRIVAIDGMGGTGKTSLAVHAAHKVADRYADGQLHLDLRGYSLHEQPATLSWALDALLRAIGTPVDRIPDDLVGRSVLWRATITGKRILLLLDNAADAAVVTGLLPNSPGCLVLVTSRARLVDLDGADWLSLGEMSHGESASLVAELLGPRSVEAEPESAAALARACGYLPLAMRIASARLRNRPAWSVGYMVERLDDEGHVLDELSLGERSVATTLRLSYQLLAEKSRTAFRLLSLHPGRDIDLHAAAAMLSLGLRATEELLEGLLDAHLVQQPAPARYAYHDLVRNFARSLCDAPVDTGGAAAVEQMLDYYLSVSESACRRLFPGRREHATGIEPSQAVLPALVDPPAAENWFAAEHLTLLSVVGMAEQAGHDRHAVHLARNVSFYANLRGNLEEFVSLSRTAVQAARRLQDPGLLGLSLSNLGVACWKLGLNDEGVAVAVEGNRLAVEIGDRQTQAHSEGTLGLYHSLQGRFSEAQQCLEAAIALEHELGLARAETETLTDLSALYEQQGRYTEAAAAARRAVALVRQVGHHETELVALTDLAFAQVGLGRDGEAEESLAAARLLCDDSKEPGQVALTLALSAALAVRRGDPGLGSAYAEEAVTRTELSVSPLRKAKTGNILGSLHLTGGNPAEALRLHRRAHEVATVVGYRIEIGYALAGMAQAAAELGEAAAAAEHRAAAEESFRALGIPARGRRRWTAASPDRG